MRTSCSEELLCRRRSGHLIADERTALDAHLEACETCALDAGLHDAFEGAGQDRPDDQRLIARVVDRALLPRARRRFRGPRPWVGATVAGVAVVIIAGLASAGLWVYQGSSRENAADGAARRGEGVARALAPTKLAPLPETPLPATDIPATPSPLHANTGHPAGGPSSPSPERARPSRARSSVASAQVSAPLPVSLPDLKTLFASANEARRAGEYARAAELYTEVERRFPESREARLSFVALGRMLLDRGQAAAALAQFERYLTTAPSDVLAAEAYYGRARALTTLGRPSDARRAWADLLSHFPDSIYADVARRQMGQAVDAVK